LKKQITSGWQIIHICKSTKSFNDIIFHILIIFSFFSTEKALQRFLKARDLLPYDYIEPDKVKHKLTKGFKD